MSHKFNFTPKAQQVFISAKTMMLRLQQRYLSTEHLLLGLLAVKQGIAARILQHMGLDIETLHGALERHMLAKRNEVEGYVNESSSNEGLDLPLTPRARQVLILAEKKSQELKHRYIGTEHLLLGLLEEGHGLAARVLQTLDIDIYECRREILSGILPENDEDENDGDDIFDTNDDVVEESDFDPFRCNPSSQRISIIRNYGQNLRLKAQNGELDPVIGREKEIERLIQILCRRTKNNPVLIGEAGVGKTAVVEGLAQRIEKGNVPTLLQDKVVFNLDLALLLSGTKYRGQFEERLKRLMEEVQQSNIILFLDELHTIVGAGSAEGSMDASNILKPALARGQFQCIGATTLKEYRQYIEKDMALNRRFQAVFVEPPSTGDTLKILEGLRPRYEAFHNVRYSESVLQHSVELTQRYITNRCFPDKAIDLLDEAGARTKILCLNNRPSTESIDGAILAVRAKKMSAIQDQKFEEAAHWRDEEHTLKTERENLIASWGKNQQMKPLHVKEETLQRIVFDWTGIPVNRMGHQENRYYLNLDKILQKKVIGQKEAIEVIARALKRSRTDLRDPNRPQGSFLFLGPTGVGKTYLVKILAEQIFGDRNAVIQIDMSEYMEKHAVARLIGSPPGYVGHEDGGQLTEIVRRKPYSIVLFDEVEKAHPDVLQILLQVLEEGHLTDTLGHRVDFKNTIIVMTSNVGAQTLQNGVGLGFGITSTDLAFEQIKSNVLSAAKTVFQPEFLNRIGDTVIFRPLSREHMMKIVDLEIENLQARLKEKSIRLTLTEEVKRFLLDKGFDEKLGARPLKRAIERYVEDLIADGLLERKIRPNHSIRLSIAPKRQSLTYTSGTAKVKKTVIKE